MGTTVNHTDEGEEECRHEAVGEHLHTTAPVIAVVLSMRMAKRATTAVGHRRVGVDVLEVGLVRRREKAP